MRESEQQFGVHLVKEHYDRLSVFYRALWGNHIHHGFFDGNESPAEAQVRLIERLATRASIRTGSRVLDVGCGVGGSSLWLARNFDCEVLGLTISPVQAAMATQLADSEGLSHRVSFEVSDANDLDFESGVFDVVWVIECSEHLLDKARFIADCARVLKPGGSLALCAWLSAENTSNFNQQLIRDVCSGMLCPGLGNISDYKNWIGQAGFEQIVAEDITQHVRDTWTFCIALTQRRDVSLLLKTVDKQTRRFVESFSAIQQAYDVGAMAYGMFTARRTP